MARLDHRGRRARVAQARAERRLGAFVDAWRELCQPAMKHMRTGELGFVWLDALHRQHLGQVLDHLGRGDFPERVSARAGARSPRRRRGRAGAEATTKELDAARSASVFDIDLRQCSRRDAAMRVLAAIIDPRVVTALLEHIDTRAARARPARHLDCSRSAPSSSAPAQMSPPSHCDQGGLEYRPRQSACTLPTCHSHACSMPAIAASAPTDDHHR